MVSRILIYTDIIARGTAIAIGLSGQPRWRNRTRATDLKWAPEKRACKTEPDPRRKPFGDDQKARRVIGSDGILAAFAAGVAFSMVTHPEREKQQQRTQEAIRRFFDVPVLVLLGMMLPWAGWLELGWGALALPAAVLLFRRLPAVLALSPLVGQIRRREDAFFYGWFGPVGIASLYYATLSLRETGAEETWVVGSLVVCASVLAHGVTATPFTRLYGGRARAGE